MAARHRTQRQSRKLGNTRSSPQPRYQTKRKQREKKIVDVSSYYFLVRPINEVLSNKTTNNWGDREGRSDSCLLQNIPLRAEFPQFRIPIPNNVLERRRHHIHAHGGRKRIVLLTKMKLDVTFFLDVKRQRNRATFESAEVLIRKVVYVNRST